MSKIVEALKRSGVRKMSSQERGIQLEKLNELKEQMKRSIDPRDGTAPRSDLLQDPGRLQTEIKKIEEMLNKDDDMIATGPERDRLSKRLKEIDELIKKEQPSERESKFKPTMQQDFEKAVLKTIHHQKTYGKLMEERQEILRRLDPDNPNV